MRFVLCFFALIASSLTVGLGVGFLLWDQGLAWALENLPADALNALGINENSTSSMTNVSYPNAALVTLAAGAYGFLGSILTMFRCGKQGGSLLFLSAVGAAVVNPISLAVTWLQLIIGLCCLLIGPMPINPPADKDADDDDEAEEQEKPKPKMKPKAKPKKFEDDDE